MTAADVPSVPDLVRDAVRAKHAPCDPKVCPLARVWADDVREIIEVADRIRRDAGDDLRPDPGGRDLTAGDVDDAVSSSPSFDPERPASMQQHIADYLNRIARGDVGSAGGREPDHGDTYDYPDHLDTAARIVAITQDIDVEEVDTTGGDYQQVRGLLAVEDHRQMRACATAMGITGDWGVDDIEQVLADAFAEYGERKAGAGSAGDDTAPPAEQMVVGKAGVPIDAYDAIQLLAARPDHPSRLLAEKARAAADWWNDPPGVLDRDAVEEAAPALAAALWELLGGGPGDVSDARPAAGPRAGDTAPDDEAPAVPQDVARRWRKERDEAREAASAFRSDAAALRDAGNALARTASGAASVLDNGGEQMTADDLRGDLGRLAVRCRAAHHRDGRHPVTATADRPYRTGRPPITSRAALLEVARGVPLDQLSTLEVARRAGVRPSTFYRHYRSVGDLHSAVAEEILTGADWPDLAGPWRPYIDGVAATLSRLVTAHPGLSRLLAGLAERPPRLQAERDRMRTALVVAGFHPVHAAVGADSVIAAALLDGDDVCGHAGRLVVAGLVAQREGAAA